MLFHPPLSDRVTHRPSLRTGRSSHYQEWKLTRAETENYLWYGNGVSGKGYRCFELRPCAGASDHERKRRTNASTLANQTPIEIFFLSFFLGASSSQPLLLSSRIGPFLGVLTFIAKAGKWYCFTTSIQIGKDGVVYNDGTEKSAAGLSVDSRRNPRLMPQSRSFAIRWRLLRGGGS
jgi:hypothetical protein